MILLSLLLHAGHAPHVHPHELPGIVLAIGITAGIILVRRLSKAATRR